MRFKKLLLCVLALSLLTLPVSAHGHGHGHHGGCHGRNAVRTVSVCPVEDCGTLGRHAHRGVTYCGYAHESGLCDNTCRALCAVEGCETAGRHVHDGVTYCGDHHEAGFCEASCHSAR